MKNHEDGRCLVIYISPNISVFEKFSGMLLEFKSNGDLDHYDLIVFVFDTIGVYNQYMNDRLAQNVVKNLNGRELVNIAGDFYKIGPAFSRFIRYSYGRNSLYRKTLNHLVPLIRKLSKRSSLLKYSVDFFTEQAISSKTFHEVVKRFHKILSLNIYGHGLYLFPKPKYDFFKSVQVSRINILAVARSEFRNFDTNCMTTNVNLLEVGWQGYHSKYLEYCKSTESFEIDINQHETKILFVSRNASGILFVEERKRRFQMFVNALVRSGRKVCILFKPHAKGERFDDLIQILRHARINFVITDNKIQTVLFDVDFVSGFFSSVCYESAIFNKPFLELIDLRNTPCDHIPFSTFPACNIDTRQEVILTEYVSHGVAYSETLAGSLDQAVTEWLNDVGNKHYFIRPLFGDRHSRDSIYSSFSADQILG